MTITIRAAVAADANAIAAFNSKIAEETEARSLDMSIVEPGVARLLSDPTKGRYWVAEDGDRTVDQIVGQIMVTYEWSDWRNGTLWWIQSVYVHSDYRRQGVFSRLYRHVETLARNEPDVTGLRLYVERDNLRAQKTYEKLGMYNPGYVVMQAIFDDSRTLD